MKALSIQQPWAWLIANGHKDVENRSWPTNFRGQFLIHAPNKIDRGGLDAIGLDPQVELDTGAIVGVAEITDCVTSHPSKWFFGRHGFVIRNARPLPPLAWRGRLGFFDVSLPPDYAAAQGLDTP